MSDSELAARLVDAIGIAVARQVEAPTTLVSVTIEVLRKGNVAEIRVELTRKTRTLAFFTAEASDIDGQRLVSASAVYKVLA